MPFPPQAEHALVIGTVAGDYHGLGRKIVAIFLRVAGFQVYDLGMSVSSAVMVDEALKVGAGVICASGLLLHTVEKVSEVRTILQARGLEDRIKLVVGGAPFNFDPQLYRSLGADAYAVNAVDAVRVVRQMFAELK